MDGDGAATIEFTVDGSTTDGTPCTLVYPAELGDGTKVYKDDFSGVKDAATLLAAAHPCLNIDFSCTPAPAAECQTVTSSRCSFFLHLGLHFFPAPRSPFPVSNPIEAS